MSLPEEKATLAFGKTLATIVKDYAKQGFLLLLQGPLGTGKTTFVRGFAESLPGGENAQISSPSFNLVNHYPTQPEIIHIDLYRLVENESDKDTKLSTSSNFSAITDESVLEALEKVEHGALALIEWAEMFSTEYLEQRWFGKWIRLVFEWDGNSRKVTFECSGGFTPIELTAMNGETF